LKYYSNGKLLITAEYLVLEGAEALALPAKYGQSLEVVPLKTISKTTKSNRLLWKSVDEKDNCWFQCEFKLPNFTIKCKTFMSKKEQEIALKLQEILLESKRLNPDFLIENQSFYVKTKTDFPLNWGLGSSSTLINNIAQWAKIDAFKLQFRVFGGSAYDIACAQNDTPIIYKLVNKKPVIKPVFFEPSFKKNLYFVHLNVKKNSRNAIKAYQKNLLNKENQIKDITEITKKILNMCLNLRQFEEIITQHEQILASILHQKTIKELLFPDYFGAIKSLGAWGGDFILATGNDATPSYFKAKGYTTILTYKQMIK